MSNDGIDRLPIRSGRALMIAAMVMAILLTAVPSQAAEKSTAKKALTRKQAESMLLDSDTFAFRGGKTLTRLQEEAKTFPDSFDLRNVDTDNDGKGDTSFVTGVKTQNPFGTCWGFAAIAAAESSLIASGLADQSIDLSEKHVSYFVNTYLDDPDSPQNGEGTHFRNVTKKDEQTQAYKYDTGGMTYMATSVFASGIGPVIETDDPDDIFGYHGLGSERVYWNVATHYDENDKPVPESYARKPVWYSSEDDWWMPESLRFTQDYRLKQSIVLPDPASKNYADGSYHYAPEAIEAIKQQLYDHHRAVCVSFCAESYLPGQDTSDKIYMSDKWAHYTFEQQYSNHAVTIVGWDDNYPASNFLKTPVDENGNIINGAFLIKNSWGSELNTFPNNAYRHWGLLEGLDGVPYDPNATAKSDRATGYFWISYADRSMNDPEAFEFTAMNEDDYYIEQSDYMYPLNLVGEIFDGVREANVFQAEATSELKSFSVFTAAPDSEVEYDLYLLGDSYDDPEDGILLESGKMTLDYGGYHLIDLAKPIVVSKGQKYSVVIKFNSPGDGDYICHSVDIDNGGNTYNVGIINPGESYMLYDGKWLDWSEESTQSIIEGYYGYYYDLIFDNFPIKTYLDPVTYPDGDQNPIFNGYLSIYNWQEGNPGAFTLDPDQTKTLAAEFRGISSDMPDSWNPVIQWTSLDNSVCTVEQQGIDSGRADIKGVAPGKTLLRVDAGEYGVRLINITVNSPEPPTPPEPVDIPKGQITSLKVKGSRKLQVNVKDQSSSGVEGYQISYRIKGKASWKNTTLKAPKKQKTLTKLTKGKKYQVRVRCYKTVDGKTVYGEWSKVKTSSKIK